MRSTRILKATAKQTSRATSKITHGGRLQWTRDAPPVRPKYGLWITGMITFGGLSYFATHAYVLAKAEPSITQRHNIPEDVSDRYNKTAAEFDKEVGFQETVMGLGWLRWWLVRKAQGNVLEVSAGTGRNSSYYNEANCKSITMLDLSPEMVEVAKRKFKSRFQFQYKAHPFYKYSRFLTQSAHDPIERPSKGYDTVVQTMGLCSTPDPAHLLRNLGQSVNSDHGQILLLEHGRGHYDWINRILDNAAPGHAKHHGCWFNRDIGKIVEESGLEVVEMKRYHFGTTWWIVLRPQKTNPKS